LVWNPKRDSWVTLKAQASNTHVNPRLPKSQLKRKILLKNSLDIDEIISVWMVQTIPITVNNKLMKLKKDKDYCPLDENCVVLLKKGISLPCLGQ